jgi:integration host factor subunit alpha
MKKKKLIGRQELSEALVCHLGLSPQKSAQVLESILEEITDHLVSQGVVKLSYFGTFFVQEKKGRMVRNPKTGEEALVSPRRRVSFKASRLLKEQVRREEKRTGRNQFYKNDR